MKNLNILSAVITFAIAGSALAQSLPTEINVQILDCTGSGKAFVLNANQHGLLGKLMNGDRSVVELETGMEVATTLPQNVIFQAAGGGRSTQIQIAVTSTFESQAGGFVSTLTKTHIGQQQNYSMHCMMGH
jgi:hypothetical protein